MRIEEAFNPFSFEEEAKKAMAGNNPVSYDEEDINNPTLYIKKPRASGSRCDFKKKMADLKRFLPIKPL